MVAKALKQQEYETATFDEAEFWQARHEVKWSSVSLAEVYARQLRLEASVFDIEGKHAREILKKCKWEITTLTGENGLATSYRPAICKRIFVDKKDGVPMFTPSQIIELYSKPTKYLSEHTNTDLNEWYLREGEVLLTCSGSIGNVSYVSDTLKNKLFSQNLIRIKAKEADDRGYIYAFLKSKIGQILIKTNNYGAVIQHIDPEHLQGIPIPNPPPILKIEIHNLIMDSFKKRDESNKLIDQAEKLLIEALDLLPLEELPVEYFGNTKEVATFSVKLTELNHRFEAAYHNPVVKAILKSLEKSAEEITVLSDKRICKDILLPGRFKRVYMEEGQGVVFFSGKHLLELDPSDKNYLSFSQHSEKIKKELTIKENMLLITCSGTIGKVNLVPKHWDGWTMTHDIVRFIPTDNKIAGYVFSWLNSEYGQIVLNRFNYGAVVQHIEAHHVSSIQIPLLKDKAKQQQINDLVLQANQKRYEAYQLEQKAIQKINEKVIYAQATNENYHDLSPIVINSVTDNKRTLHFKPGLVLNPKLDKDSPELITIEDEQLNIHAYAINRDILIEELTAELFLLWDEYAQESPEKLTTKARILRETLLKRCYVEE